MFCGSCLKTYRVGDPSGPKLAALLSVPGFIARGSRTERFASGSSLHRSKSSSEYICKKEQQKIKVSFACRKTKETQCQSTLNPAKTLWLATTRCQTAAHAINLDDRCVFGGFDVVVHRAVNAACSLINATPFSSAWFTWSRWNNMLPITLPKPRMCVKCCSAF